VRSASPDSHGAEVGYRGSGHHRGGRRGGRGRGRWTPVNGGPRFGDAGTGQYQLGFGTFMFLCSLHYIPL